MSDRIPIQTAPEDGKLTAQGLAPMKKAGDILLIACGALAHEILALIKQNRWQHMQLLCLPAILHNTPDKIPDAVRALILKHRNDFNEIFVVYADCGTGGDLQAVCTELGVEMMQGPHCYAFYEGITAFSEHDEEITAFYLTDFLVRQFDAFVWKPLGLDRHPELLGLYFGNYTKLVYQAQTDDAALDEKARDCARRLGLEYERRATGYGDLKTALRRVSRQ